MRVDAKAVIGTEVNPQRDGATLARHLLDHQIPLASLEIDVGDLAPEDLVSSFVNSMLHEIEAAGRSVADAGQITWHTRYESEGQRLRELVAYFVEDSRQNAG